LFLSAGEPSGDLHAANLARAIRLRQPNLPLVGFGGPRSAAAGVLLRYPLTELSVMWASAAKHLATFFTLARRTEVEFRRRPPAALVMVDYPGFHFALAKRAYRAGVPVYWFVPPQLWAWHGSRAEKVRRWVRTVFTALPFEDDWYRGRGCHTRYVGHPYFDELRTRTVDEEWVAERTRLGPVVAILPGSRTQEVKANVPMMLAASDQIRQCVPGVRFLVAAFREKHAVMVRQLLAGREVEVCFGRTPEVIRAATVAMAVSGSVGLELLHDLLPTVVVYKTSHLFEQVARRVANFQHVSIVNLLAGRELFPEVAGGAWAPDRIADPLVRCLTDPAARTASQTALRELRDRIAVPGACDRAADALIADLQSLGRLPR
jgi:lipid-A-disaccharide synthase